jgi:cysteine desulfurase
MIYLDNASTTIIEKEVLDSYQALLSAYYANPSSSHKLGVQTNALQNKAREMILKLLNLNGYEVIFTSGATESNNLLLRGLAFAYQNRGKHIITSSVEHPSILNTCKQLEELHGFKVTYLGVNQDGTINLDELKSSIQKDTILVSLMLVNNETGAINPLKEVKNILKDYPQVVLHSDAVQGFSKIKFDFNNVDAFTLSSHKIHGLKGSGALIKRKSIRLVSQLTGGNQEDGYRSGTSNFPVNVTLAKTIRLALEKQDENYKKVKVLHDYLFDELENNDQILINSTRNGSPYIFNLSLKDKKGPVIAQALNNEDIYVSTVSACSNKTEPKSKVIYEMFNDDNRAKSSLRISFSKDTTLKEVEIFKNALIKILSSVK